MMATETDFLYLVLLIALVFIIHIVLSWTNGWRNEKRG
jgi:hypothetical protein